MSIEKPNIDSADTESEKREEKKEIIRITPEDWNKYMSLRSMELDNPALEQWMQDKGIEFSNDNFLEVEREDGTMFRATLKKGVFGIRIEDTEKIAREKAQKIFEEAKDILANFKEKNSEAKEICLYPTAGYYPALGSGSYLLPHSIVFFESTAKIVAELFSAEENTNAEIRTNPDSGRLNVLISW